MFDPERTVEFEFVRATENAALNAMSEKIKRYEDILGTTLTDLSDAVTKVQGAVDAHAAIDDLSL